MRVAEPTHSPQKIAQPERAPGRPPKTADYHELVASILEAQVGLEILKVMRPVPLAGHRSGSTADCALVWELRPICRFKGVAAELTRDYFGEVRNRRSGTG